MNKLGCKGRQPELEGLLVNTQKRALLCTRAPSHA
jgi:hypothetical protein